VKTWDHRIRSHPYLRPQIRPIPTMRTTTRDSDDILHPRYLEWIACLLTGKSIQPRHLANMRSLQMREHQEPSRTLRLKHHHLCLVTFPNLRADHHRPFQERQSVSLPLQKRDKTWTKEDLAVTAEKSTAVVTTQHLVCDAAGRRMVCRHSRQIT